MAFLKRDQVKQAVIDALKTVANVPANVETADFKNMTDLQKHMFLSALITKLNALPYNMNDGSTNHLAYYDVDLTPDSIDDWPTVKDC
ncbi:MAG TPA: hypothetical protein VGI82_07855, partial [Chitinophagaceae bacterium]